MTPDPGSATPEGKPSAREAALRILESLDSARDRLDSLDRITLSIEARDALHAETERVMREALEQRVLDARELLDEWMRWALNWAPSPGATQYAPFGATRAFLAPGLAETAAREARPNNIEEDRGAAMSLLRLLVSGHRYEKGCDINGGLACYNCRTVEWLEAHSDYRHATAQAMKEGSG